MRKAKIMPPEGRTIGTWKMGDIKPAITLQDFDSSFQGEGPVLLDEHGQTWYGNGYHNHEQFQDDVLKQGGGQEIGRAEIQRGNLVSWPFVKNEYIQEMFQALQGRGLGPDSKVVMQGTNLPTTAGLWEQPAPFQLPHSVEMAFVHAMECPWCHSNLLMDRPIPKSPEKVYCPVCGWKPRDVKTAAGYSDDFRTLVGMMKNALNNEDYSEIYQLCARMSILADELESQAKVEHTFDKDSVPGHSELLKWMYPNRTEEWKDLIDKHVSLQNSQSSLPSNIKQYVGFIEKAIIDGNLTGFKKEMLPNYVQSALKQFHETGNWQGIWQVLKDDGKFEDVTNDPEKSMSAVDGLFELEMSKSDPVYQKLQNAVHMADDVARYIQWIDQTLDSAHGKYQDYLDMRGPWQQQYDDAQSRWQEMQQQYPDMFPQARIAAYVDVQLVDTDNFYLGEEGEPQQILFDIQLLGVTPEVVNAYVEGHPVGSIVYFPLTNPELLAMIPGDEHDPVMWVEWIYVDPEYRDSNVFNELALTVKNAADKAGLPIKAFYQNEKLKRVMDRYFQRAAGQNGPLPENLQIQETRPGKFEGYINGEWVGQIGIDNQHQIHVSVSPEWRRRGIATALLQYLQHTYPEFVPSHSELISDEGLSWAQTTPNTMWPPEQSVVEKSGPGYQYQHSVGRLPEEEITCPNCGSYSTEVTMLPSLRRCWDCNYKFDPKGQFEYPQENIQKPMYAAFDAPLENPVSYEWHPWTDQELAQWDQQNKNTWLNWKRRARNLTRGARRRGYAGTVTGRDLFLLNNRYQGKCAYCGQPGATSWDHVTPLALGGEHTPSNILPAHLQCNFELGRWDDRNRDYVNPNVQQMRPDWTIQPAEASWKPQRIARLRGFRVWSADLHEMAEQKRLEAKDAIKAWSGERWQLAWALIQQMPDQGYKLMPWLTREITKRDLMDTQQWHHIQDIMEQASKWFDWSREHNKPLPEFNRKDFGFDQMEQWVYEMNANQNVSDEWTDSTPVYTWEDGWHMDRVGPDDLAKEGELMGHCVGGYCNVVNAGNSSIFSLRDPKGMPHVTLEIEGNYDGVSNPDETDAGSSFAGKRGLRVIQVQGKSDTEPIPEYRRYIDDWFETLQVKGWTVEEEDPDREPEYEYHEHPEGPYYLDDPEDYLRYHDIMTNHYDRQYHFEESEEGEYDAPANTFNYDMPRALVLNSQQAEDWAQNASDFIQKWQAGQYTNEDALKYVQAMWMSLHHSAGDGQRHRTDMWPRQDADGNYLHSEQLHQVVQKFWQDIEEILYWKAVREPKPAQGDTLFNVDEYNGETLSPQAEMFLGLMAKFDSAPYDYQEPVVMHKQNPPGEGETYPRFLYRNPAGEETTDSFQNGQANKPIMIPRLDESGKPQMVNRWLQWPGENAYPGTDYDRYFEMNGLNQFPSPTAMASWVPLEAHQIDPPGIVTQAWSLTSWKRIEPSEELRNIAHGYMANQGWGEYDPPQTYPDVDPERAARIAEEYDKMEHNPNDPAVREAYDALIRETMAQYDYLTKNGYQLEFEPYGETPYPSPWDAINDIRENKHLYVYPTYRAFGQGDDDGLGDIDHPLIGHAGFEWPEGQRSTPVTYNDVFRGVHDIFGHAKEGVGFRSDGEENAWRQHSAMYSEPARRALTSETRGQNSWVNYGPYGQQNQTADQANTVYAEQKAGIMPDWTVYEGAHDE